MVPWWVKLIVLWLFGIKREGGETKKSCCKALCECVYIVVLVFIYTGRLVHLHMPPPPPLRLTDQETAWNLSVHSAIHTHTKVCMCTDWRWALGLKLHFPRVKKEENGSFFEGEKKSSIGWCFYPHQSVWAYCCLEFFVFQKYIMKHAMRIEVCIPKCLLGINGFEMVVGPMAIFGCCSLCFVLHEPGLEQVRN